MIGGFWNAIQDEFKGELDFQGRLLGIPSDSWITFLSSLYGLPVLGWNIFYSDFCSWVDCAI